MIARRSNCKEWSSERVDEKIRKAGPDRGQSSTNEKNWLSKIQRMRYKAEIQETLDVVIVS